jgi:hypothetical protein
MTESEIMKALECCVKEGGERCPECPLDLFHNEGNKWCDTVLMENAINLINRKNAEIDGLKSHSGKCIYLSDDETTEFCVEGACKQFKTEGEIRAEAIKEFAERAKKGCFYWDFIARKHRACTDLTHNHIDQIAKEMGVEL